MFAMKKKAEESFNAATTGTSPSKRNERIYQAIDPLTLFSTELDTILLVFPNPVRYFTLHRHHVAGGSLTLRKSSHTINLTGSK
jgi:hypothetical protein